MSETVVITGASMGIGRELALAWAARSATVVISARGKPALDEVAAEVERAGGRAIVVVGDVTDEAHRQELVDRAVREGGSLDVLVNNAGRGFYAPAMKIDIEDLKKVFDLNVFAPVRLTQLAEPALAKSRGTVVMMSSVAGVVAAPRLGGYAASKFALEALSMAMRAELSKSGVRVVVVRPGPVKTPFRSNAARAEGEVGYDAPDPKGQDAAEVARITMRAVERGRSIAETSAYVRGISAAQRFLPPAVRLALKRIAEKTL